MTSYIYSIITDYRDYIGWCDEESRRAFVERFMDYRSDSHVWYWYSQSNALLKDWVEEELQAHLKSDTGIYKCLLGEFFGYDGKWLPDPLAKIKELILEVCEDIPDLDDDDVCDALVPGDDDKCTWCNARGCDAIVNGEPVHTDCI